MFESFIIMGLVAAFLFLVTCLLISRFRVNALTSEVERMKALSEVSYCEGYNAGVTIGHNQGYEKALKKVGVKK
jgi:hypothetical protein